MSARISKKIASVSHIVLALTAGVTDPLPTVDPPSPPAGFVATKATRGFRPQKSQIAQAAKAATELRSSTSYAQTFGAGAPAAATVADALTTASDWSAKLQLASAWYAYVKQQEALAWKHALGVSDPLRVPFQYQAERDPNVATEFPSLTAFYAAPKETAAKAAATKKKKKTEKAAPAPQPTQQAGTGKLLN